MKRMLRFAYVASVILLGFTFFTSGMGKLFAGHQFPGFIGPVWLAERLKEYHLGLYAHFIGYAQVSIGFMLLTYRFRTLAAIMLVPMLANILMVTISLEWQGTPYIVGMLLAMNLYLLWYDRHQLLHLLSGKPSEKIEQRSLSLNGSLLWLGAYLLTLSSIILSFYQLVLAWVFVGLSLLLGLFSEKIARKIIFKFIRHSA
ncbi:MAG: hypothetical protein ACLFUB_10605 [Cyclobacteriaceae bacterium]